MPPRKKSDKKDAKLQPHFEPTLEAAAKAMGVHRRTFMEWTGKPGFPERTDSGFNIDDIRLWRDSRGSANSDGEENGDLSEVKARLLAARLLREESDAGRSALVLKKDLGKLIERDDARRFLERMVATVHAVLGPLADQVDNCLPRSLASSERARVRAEVDELLENAFAVVEQDLTNDDDDEIDEEEDGNDAIDEGIEDEDET